MDNKAQNTGPQGGHIDIHCIILLGFRFTFEIFTIKVKIVNLKGWNSWSTGRPGDLESETDPHPLTSSLVYYIWTE